MDGAGVRASGQPRNQRVRASRRQGVKAMTSGSLESRRRRRPWGSPLGTRSRATRQAGEPVSGEASGCAQRWADTTLRSLGAQVPSQRVRVVAVRAELQHRRRARREQFAFIPRRLPHVGLLPVADGPTAVVIRKRNGEPYVQRVVPRRGTAEVVVVLKTSHSPGFTAQSDRRGQLRATRPQRSARSTRAAREPSADPQWPTTTPLQLCS